MVGLTVQNFVTPAVGICVLVAMIRGIVARGGTSLGNFWQDLVRGVYYVLLPLSIVVALVLVSQGVVQTLGNAVSLDHAERRRPDARARPGRLAGRDQAARHQRRRLLQRQLGDAVREPEPADQLRRAARDRADPGGPHLHLRAHGRAPARGLGDLRRDAGDLPRPRSPSIIPAEQHGTPAQHAAGTPTAAIAGSTGGNLEGKEQRNGITDSALWATTTTVTSNGSVNSAHESYTGLGGAVTMSGLATSEVVFGGVGTGLYSMLLFVLLAVFIGGLMVGRTPEYLGKKIQAREIKLISLGRAVHAARGAGHLRAGDGGPRRHAGRSTKAAPRASPRPSTPTSRRPTTTAPPSPATPASSSPTRPATPAPTGSPSPTCSAARR